MTSLAQKIQAKAMSRLSKTPLFEPGMTPAKLVSSRKECLTLQPVRQLSWRKLEKHDIEQLLLQLHLNQDEASAISATFAAMVRMKCPAHKIIAGVKSVLSKLEVPLEFPLFVCLAS